MVQQCECRSADRHTDRTGFNASTTDEDGNSNLFKTYGTFAPMTRVLVSQGVSHLTPNWLFLQMTSSAPIWVK